MNLKDIDRKLGDMMKEEKIVNKHLDIPFKDFMPGQVIQSSQFNDDMLDIEDKVNEVIDKHNLNVNKLHDHLDDKENPHEVNPHQIGTYEDNEIDGFVADIKNGNLNDEAITNRVLADACVDNRVLVDGVITLSKLDANIGNQIDISNNMSIKERYTKLETDAIIQEKVGDGTYSKEQIDAKFEEYQAGTIVDGTIDVSKLKSDVGRKLDITHNPSISNRYTKSEVNTLIAKNGLPKDWGNLSDEVDDEIVTQNGLGSLPISDVMVCGEFKATETDVLNVKIQDVEFAKGEFNTLEDRLDSVDTQLAHNVNFLEENQLLIGYKLKCDGTDSVDDLQRVLNDIGDNKRKLVFPYKSKFYIDKQLILPSNVDIDFNNSTFEVLNNIPLTAIIVNSETKLKNLNIIQKDNNYSAVGGVNGIDILSSNVIIENIYTKGFENGICVKGTDNERVGIITIRNCKCTFAEMSGILLSNCKNVYVENCISKHNRFDGLKTTGKTDYIHINGGSYSYNENPTDTYADGIDLYSGGRNCRINGVVCEYNGGAGLHILSGEDSLDGTVGNITVSNSHFINNKGNGFDVLNKSSIEVSPYVTSVVFDNCISKGNRYGCQLQGRNINISNSIFKYNYRYGVYIVKGIFINVNNCNVLKNSIENKGALSGVVIDSSNFVTIDNCFINGYDSNSIQEEAELESEKYHLYGIQVQNTVNCDNLLFNNVTILNNANARQISVSNFTSEENKNKNIIAHLNYVTSNPTHCNFSMGSTIIKDGVFYEKNTDLNSTIWSKKNICKKGITEYYMDNTNTMTIAHGLGYLPTYYTVTPANLKSAEKGDYYVEVDENNIYIKYLTAFTTKLKFSWYVE